MAQFFMGWREMLTVPRYMLELFDTRIRRVAVCILLLPIPVCFAFHYYVFHLAGGWLVSTSLAPDHRATFLAFEFLLIFASFTAVAEYVGFFLLYLDGYHRKWLFWILIPLVLAAGPGIAVLVFTISCYFEFN